MKNVFKIAALACATLVSATQAQAQDWSGAYAGAYVGSAYSGTEVMAGALVGYQFQTGSIVVGAEGDVFYAQPSGDFEAFAKARAGFVVANDSLLFATLGAGTYNGTTFLVSAGAGAEYRVNTSLSLRGDVELHNTSLSTLTTGQKFYKLGAVWHF